MADEHAGGAGGGVPPAPEATDAAWGDDDEPEDRELGSGEPDDAGETGLARGADDDDAGGDDAQAEEDDAGADGDAGEGGDEPGAEGAEAEGDDDDDDGDDEDGGGSGDDDDDDDNDDDDDDDDGDDGGGGGGGGAGKAAAGDDDEDSEDQQIHKSRRKRQRHMSAALDEDDYALLEENTGRAFKRREDESRKYRRLNKRARVPDEGEEGAARGAGEGEEGDEAVRAGRELEQELFDGDDDVDDADDEPAAAERESEIGSDDEDGFIVDEEGRAVRLDRADDEDAGRAEEVEEAQDIFGTAEELAELLALTKHQGADAAMEDAGGAENGEAAPDGRADVLGGAALDDDDDDAELEGLDVDDDDDDDGADDDDDEDARLERQRVKQEERVARRRAARAAQRSALAKDTTSKMHKLYPPSMLAKKFMLPADEQARVTDVPERLQPVHVGRAPPAEGELRLEAEWIAALRGQDWLAAADGGAAAAVAAERVASLVPGLTSALRLMREQLLEVPTIVLHRKDDIGPALQEEWLWEVQRLDERWAKLAGRRAELRALWSKGRARLGVAEGSAEDQSVTRALEAVTDEERLADLGEHLGLRLGAARERGLGGAAGSTAGPDGRPLKHGLLEAAQRSGVEALLSQLGLTSAQFADNLKDGWPTHAVVEAVDTAEGAAEAFMAAAIDEHGGKPPPGLPTGLASDALAAMRELAAHQLASEPEVREYVREHVVERAMLTVELTEKGEKLIDAAHEHAELRRYNGEPLRRLVRARGARAGADRPVSQHLLPVAERERALLSVLRAKRAESEGLCSVRVAMPEYGALERDELYAEMLRAFCPSADDPLPEADPEGEARASWNGQRCLLLARALTGLLYERTGRALEAQLQADGQRALLRACADALDQRVADARPLRDRELWERRPLQHHAYAARALLVAACKDPNSPTVMFAKLAPDGELVDYLRCEWLHVSARLLPARLDELGRAERREWRTRSEVDRSRKADELSKLADFLGPTELGSPSFVVIGASHLRCRELRTELEHLSRALAVRAVHGDDGFTAYNTCAHPLGRTEMVEGPLGRDAVFREPFHDVDGPAAFPMSLAEMNAAAPFRVVYGSEEVPALYAASEEAARELGDRHALLWRAVSLGRAAQDFVLELAHVAGAGGEALAALHLHPLQSAVPREALVAALRARLVSTVARLGVNLPWVVAHGSHARHVLQFVPGLGPRKAARLFEQLVTLAQLGNDVASRAGLLERGLLGPTVYRNLAPFIFFAPLDDDAEVVPTLEMTRVHPEHYEFARQLCVQAAADDDEEDLPEEEGAINEAVSATIGKRDELNQLEVVEYARHLRGEEIGGVQTVAEPRELELQLTAMQAALIEPYADPREVLVAPSPDAPPPLDGSDAPQVELLRAEPLFEQLTGETTRTLTSGLLVARAVRQGTRERVSGMWCALDNGMQAFLPAELMSNEMSDGYEQSEMPVAVGATFHCVVLSPNDIDQAKCEVTISCRGGDLARADFRSVAEQRAHDERPAAPKVLKRRITHPLFQNVLYERACEILKQGTPGDVLFRPSSKGDDHLTMSWVWAPETILHVDVLERDKPSAEQLGRTLVVGYAEGRSEGEAFEALDEIHARYAAPISDLVSEAMTHRKFLHKKQAEVDSLLRREKAEAPASIPYRVSVCDKAPGHLVLSYVPSKSVKHELVSVKPAGFRLRSVVHSSLEEMLRWFKRNWQNAPPPPPPRPEPLPPPVSSWPNQQSLDSGWDSGNDHRAVENARANAQAASNFLGGLM